MTFWEAFFRTLRWRPRQALAGLYWHITRRRVRARNRLRVGAAQAPYAYDYWVQSSENSPALAACVPAIIEKWQRRPKLSVVMYETAGVGHDEIRRTLAYLKSQVYTDWELICAIPNLDAVTLECHNDPRFMFLSKSLSTAAEQFAAGVAFCSGDFLVPLRAGQLLSASALYHFAEALQGTAKPSIVYGDQDEINLRGRRTRPWFKPQWDEEMFLAQDYLSEACAVDVHLARAVLPQAHLCSEAPVFAFLLAATRAAPGAIVHVAQVLCHVTSTLNPSDQKARVEAVARHLAPLGAMSKPGPFETVKTEWPLPDAPPRVTIIIPTRDKVHLLRACVESVLAATTYPNFELMIVDNGSTDRDALAYLAQVGERENVRVLTYDHPYNYSAINNFAVERCSASYLCLLNNDTEVISPEWLTEMMRYAVRPQVGAVGAKLLYEDGAIQHAGVVIGICEAAGHAHRFEPSKKLGYFGRAHVAHVVSAVTAACLVVEKRKFETVGGLDAQSLAVAYNDVDLCLKLERAGWHNIYVPHAELVHHESKSRGQDISPKNIERYMRELAVLQERWGTKTYRDPRHHPNLDRYSENFNLRL